jgi:hypothetical protein
MKAIPAREPGWRHVASRSTEAADVVDASDDGVSVVGGTGAVDDGESWSMCDLDLEHFLQSPCTSRRVLGAVTRSCGTMLTRRRQLLSRL